MQASRGLSTIVVLLVLNRWCQTGPAYSRTGHNYCCAPRRILFGLYNITDETVYLAEMSWGTYLTQWSSFLLSKSEKVRKMNVHVDSRRIPTTTTSTMTFTSCSSSSHQPRDVELLLVLLLLFQTSKSVVFKSNAMIAFVPLIVVAASVARASTISHVPSATVTSRRSASRPP